MAWLFEFDLGSGFVDKTSLVKTNTVDRRFEVHKDLNPTTNELNFTVGPDASFYNSLLAGGSDVPIRVTKDGVRFFTGLVQRIPETSVTGALGPMSIKAYDSSIKLKRKMAAPYKKLSSTVSVIAGELLAAAGVSSVNLGTISKSIDCASWDTGTTYWDALEKLLGDFGYVLYFDETDTARAFLLFPATVSPTKTYQTGASGNIIDELKVARKAARYGGARVTFYRHDARSNLIVFSDPTGAGSLNKCNIDLTQYSGVYPPRSGSEEVYCEYAVEEGGVKRELLATNSVTFSILGSAITVAQAVDFGLKAAIKVTGSGIITRLDVIAGSAILKGAKVVKESIISGLSEEIFERECAFIQADADADYLVSGERAYFANSGVTFSFKTEDDVTLGEVVTLIDATLGYNLSALVVGFNEDDQGKRRVWCEALVAYSAQAVTTSGSAISYPNPPNGVPIVQVADVTAPTVPSGLAVSQLSTGALRVSFNASTDTESGVALYRVYRRENGTTQEGVVTDVNGAGSGPFSVDDTSPVKGKSYQYAVSAVDARGNESAKSAWSTATQSVVSDPPAGVAGLAAAATAAGVTISWTGASDAIAYRLEKSTDGGSTWPTILTINTNSQFEALAAGTEPSALANWRYRVKAISKDGVLSSSYSSVVSVTVGSWTWVPAAPTMIAATAKRSAKVVVTPQASLVDPDGWDFQISRDNSTWYAPNLAADADADPWYTGSAGGFLTAYDVALNIDYLPISLVCGLPRAAGEAYYFRARARGKSAGAGSWCASAGPYYSFPHLYADFAIAQVKASLLALGKTGWALNADPAFNDAVAWALFYDMSARHTAAEIVEVTDGLGGNFAAQASAASYWYSDPVPVDPAKAYRLSVAVKEVSGSPEQYLGVCFRDSAGAVVNSFASGWLAIGSYHYCLFVYSRFPTTRTRYEFCFGTGTAAGIPATAKTMQLVWLGNYSGSGVAQIQDYRVEEMVAAGVILAGSITTEKLAALSVTSAKIGAGQVTADKISVTSLSAIKADLGTVTAGVIRSSNWVSGTTGFIIDLNNARMKAENGAWSIEAAGNFRFGGSSQYVAWDGSGLFVAGSIQAESGTFKGVIESPSLKTTYSLDLPSWTPTPPYAGTVAWAAIGSGLTLWNTIYYATGTFNSKTVTGVAKHHGIFNWTTWTFGPDYVEVKFSDGTSLIMYNDSTSYSYAGTVDVGGGAGDVLSMAIKPMATDTYALGSTTARWAGLFCGAISCNGAIIPTTDNTRDLGSDTYAFRKLYCGSFDARDSGSTSYVDNLTSGYKLEGTWIKGRVIPGRWELLYGTASWTVPASWGGLALVSVFGGGGGGGGSGGKTAVAGATGGGGGGGAGQVKWGLYMLTPGAVIPLSIGAAGSAGAAGTTAGGAGGTGGTGGTSIWASGMAHALSASGGAGGVGSAGITSATAGAGGAGGAGGGGGGGGATAGATVGGGGAGGAATTFAVNTLSMAAGGAGAAGLASTRAGNGGSGACGEKAGINGVNTVDGTYTLNGAGENSGGYGGRVLFGTYMGGGGGGGARGGPIALMQNTWQAYNGGQGQSGTSGTQGVGGEGGKGFASGGGGGGGSGGTTAVAGAAGGNGSNGGVIVQMIGLIENYSA